MTTGIVDSVVDHGSIVQVYLIDEERKLHVVNFDRRQFSHFWDAEGPITEGMTLYHGFTEDGIEIVSTEPINDE